VDTVFVGMMSI